jgi:hypothetical protein
MITGDLFVLGAVGVGMTDEDGLPMVVELAVGHCNTGNSVRDV